MDYKKIDEDREETKKFINRCENYSKNVLYGGVLGLFASAINYYFTGEPSSNVFQVSSNEMTNAQLISTLIFSISTVAYIGGGLIYGLANFFENDFEKNLEIKEKMNNLEKNLKD